MARVRHGLLAAGVILAGASALLSEPARAATAAELNANGKAALNLLYSQSERARRYSRDAHAILVFPKIVKAGLMIGGLGGEGVLFERGRPTGYYKIAAASFGFQAGGQQFSYALFFMNDKSVRSLLHSKFTLGAKAGVAAGPVGRSAEGSTDLKLDAEIYSYAQSKGVFAGISLEGASVATDREAIARYYGQRIDPETILFERGVSTLPPEARDFVEALPAR